jgi:hypothetical protein
MGGGELLSGTYSIIFCPLIFFKFSCSLTSVYKPYVRTAAGFLGLFVSTSTTVVLLFASEHTHKLCTRASTVYKFIKRASWCS